MRVYIANFGRANWAWPECLRRHSIAVMDDERIHRFWQARDKDAYVREAQRVIRHADGSALTKPVASRSFNLNDVVMQTAGDYWIHREKEELWWSVSGDQQPVAEIVVDPNPRADFARVYVYYKPCTAWSDQDKSGRPLSWRGLHPRAKEFLFTEATCQQLSEDNANYAKALLSGDNLSPWHDRSDWKEIASRAKQFPVTHFDARRRTIARMAMTALRTVEVGGTTSTVTKKEKGFSFRDQYELERYLEQLVENQEGLCALTGIDMVLDGEEGDSSYSYSLDRINSNDGYERGNLQIVCKFVNRWKGNTDNGKFLELIERIVAAAATN